MARSSCSSVACSMASNVGIGVRFVGVGAVVSNCGPLALN